MLISPYWDVHLIGLHFVIGTTIAKRSFPSALSDDAFKLAFRAKADYVQCHGRASTAVCAPYQVGSRRLVVAVLQLLDYLHHSLDGFKQVLITFAPLAMPDRLLRTCHSFPTTYL